MILLPSGFHSGIFSCCEFCHFFVLLSCSKILSADLDLCPYCHLSVFRFGTDGVLLVFGSLVLSSMSSVIGSRLLPFLISFSFFLIS